MSRIFVVVEGQTEEAFVKEVLLPYLNDYGVYDVTPIVIHTNTKHYKGGFVNYAHLRNDIVSLLRSQGDDAFVTTFVDFFRIFNTIPHHDEIAIRGTHLDQVEMMQKAIDKDIDDRRFSSYIQLHEFEALLFSSNKGFGKWMDEKKMLTGDIIKEFPNPEDINTSTDGAPSKRLLAIQPNYDKVMQGNLIALEVGIKQMLDKCPRFRQWVNLLITRGKS
jgi:hypothetical protein